MNITHAETRNDGEFGELRFTVREDKGAGDESLFTVLDHGQPCGSYSRNYCSFGTSTFAPFTVGQRWYALYSPDYTCTRVMSLPDCIDIGGEEPDTFGFCPVELWVPRYRCSSFDVDCRVKGDGPDGYVAAVYRVTTNVFQGSTALAEAEARIIAEQDTDGRRVSGARISASELSGWMSCPFGLISGCHWGDDSAFKAEFFDLANADKGLITRQARFGYAEIHSEGGLRESVNLDRWTADNQIVTLQAVVFHDLAERFIAQAAEPDTPNPQG